MYYNPIYEIIDENVVRMQLQQKQKYHNDQIMKTADCVRKLKDFLDSIDRVAPEYQQLTFEQCCIALGQHYHERQGVKM